MEEYTCFPHHIYLKGTTYSYKGHSRGELHRVPFINVSAIYILTLVVPLQRAACPPR